jgi:glucose-1-phosphate cytidylyltransferase
MKAVILAGGLGTRISEESHLRPKPMIEIGGKPILWHIMKTYSEFGINEFIVCLGYKGYLIKEYFFNYYLHESDVTIDLKSNSTTVHKTNGESWKVTLVDTGAETMTGGRIKKILPYLDGDQNFCLTYGDGVSDIDIDKLISHHNENNKLVTVTAVQPPGRYGSLQIEAKMVSNFLEKPIGDGAWINGGYFVVNVESLNFIDGDHSSWEDETLIRIVENGELTAYQHRGFWQSMDTLRDKNFLESKWNSGEAPWKIWT